MKTLSLAIIACLAITSSFSEAAAPFYTNGANTRAVPNSYIVVLKNNTARDTFQPKFNNMVKHILKSNGPRLTKINRHYEFIPAFTADLDQVALKDILNMPEVDYVEQNVRFRAFDTQTSPPSWGLSRVSGSKAVKNLTSPFPPYNYPKSAGENVTVYVLDSGIHFDHPDFEGRATHGKNFVTNSTVDLDQDGHGTHVAATIGGKRFGVAKKVKLVSVKVLDEHGEAYASEIIEGMEWVLKQAKGKRAIVNMSLGGSRTKTVDNLAYKIYSAGIPIIVAAGNEYTGHPACEVSPAGAKGVFTVSATTVKDRIAEFSSLGNCVKMFAPGEMIKSASFLWDKKSQTFKFGSTFKNGTSMATPHAAGVAALYMSEDKNLKTPKQIYAKLTSTATKGAIKGDFQGAPDLLLSYKGAK
ncbi:hypothetical protein BGX34_002917 [Mortierella sp. NVP85]|nr:hypothetical protein BGX34_002917 [Mortierella sp. NVP85]